MSRVSRGTQPPDLTLRMGYGFYRLNERAYPGKVTQTELANRVAERAGGSFSQTAASGWLSGRVPRDLEGMEALAIELDLEPNWLYFNRGDPPEGFADWVEKVNGQSPYTAKILPYERQEKPPTLRVAERKKRR